MTIKKQRLGEIRKSMATNPLLLSPPVGRPLVHGYTLPGPDFVYGMKNIDDPAGAKGAMRQDHDICKKTSHHNLAKDFIALNRESIKNGLVTEKEQKQFRKTHDIRCKNSQNMGKISDTSPPDIYFGVPTRPSTPIFDLLEHKYQTIWTDQQLQREDRCKEASTVKHRIGKNKNGEIIVFETKASQMRKAKHAVEDKGLWQMSKFKKVGPQLKTFRTDVDRDAAFEAHMHDRSGRRGIQGHGVYQPSKS